MGGRAGGGASGGMGRDGGALARNLASHEASIRLNDSFETLTAFDDKGNMLFSKKGEQHYVEYGADGVKTTNAIVTHNHPSGASFSAEDMAGMVRYNQKEMRATGKEYTFSMKRPKGGWGISHEKAARYFHNAYRTARNEYMQQKTGNASSDRALWINLTHKWNGEVAKYLGWNYSVKKNK